MTGQIFSNYIIKLNAQFRRQDRKVLLFVDNCSAHIDQRLDNLKLVYFPVNCTSVLQPMDQGVIRSLKAKYRAKMLTHIIREIESNDRLTANDVKIDILMAMNWIKFAWESVTGDTIKNCFKKAHFVKDQDEDQNEDIHSLHEAIAEIESEIREKIHDIGEGDATDFITFDDNLVAVDPLDIDDDETEVEDDNETEVEDEDEIDIVPISIKEAAKAMSTLRDFFFQENFTSHQDFQKFENDFHKRQSELKEQSLITDFIVTQPMTQ